MGPSGIRLATALALCVLSPAAIAGTPLRLERAEVSSVAGGPLPADPEWQEVSLPHRWGGAGVAEPADHWYRFEVDLGPAPAGLQAVLLPDVAMNAEVVWNRVPLGHGGRFDPPIAQNFHTPLYFRVPERLVRPGPNELRVRVATAPHFFGWLGPVEVGPDALLAPVYEAGLFARQTLPRATSVLGAVLAVLAAAFWLASRDTLYAFFAASIACSTFADLNLHVRDIPLPTMPWARLIQWAVAMSPLCFALFAHRLAGVDRPRGERGLAAWAVLVTAIAAFVPAGVFLPTLTALHLPSLAIGLYALGLIALHLWRSQRADLAIFAAAALLLLAIGVHDTAIQFGEREGAPRYLSALGAPTFFLAFGSLVTLRFVRTFRRAERQNEELEGRVREKHEELEAQFARLRDLERERVLAGERERMMREMHDGLGGRLVETLSMVETGNAASDEVASALRASLDEMRLLVDSLDPLVEDLPGLLATVRERLEPSLRRQGISLSWQVERLPELPRLGPGDFLHVLRIAQEALTNVLKHANASRVTVRARAEGDGVRVEIEDDGRGARGDDTRATGRGVENMRKRAGALGGTLELRPAEPAGTVVSLFVPA